MSLYVSVLQLRMRKGQSLYLLDAAVQIEGFCKGRGVCAPLWPFLKLGKKSPAEAVFTFWPR